MGAVRLPNIPVLTIDDSLSALRDQQDFFCVNIYEGPSAPACILSCACVFCSVLVN